MIVQTYAAGEQVSAVQLTCSESSKMLPRVNVSCYETSAQTFKIVAVQGIFLVSRSVVFVCLGSSVHRNLSYSNSNSCCKQH